jgi:4-aminobutyrate aminotransferase/(S)-3-amino-2-methylpropionate transaminase
MEFGRGAGHNDLFEEDASGRLLFQGGYASQRGELLKMHLFQVYDFLICRFV